jgi:hypothetical protein
MLMWLEVIVQARRRFLANVVVTQSSHALNACLGMLLLTFVFGTDLLAWSWLTIPPSLTLAAGDWRAWRRFPGDYPLAQIVDTRLALGDVLSTAVFFSSAPNRHFDEGMRRAQCDMASRVAASVKPAEAIPLRFPRAMVWSMLFAALAAGLLTVRFRIDGRLDLHRSMVPGFQQLARMVQDEIDRAEKALADLMDSPTVAKEEEQKDPSESPEDSSPSGRKSSVAGEKSPGDAKSQVARENGQSREESRDRDDTMAEDPQNEGAPSGENGSTNSQGNQQSASRQNQSGQPNQSQANPGQQQNGSSGESSSVFAKLSNSMANLLSALKPPPGASGQQVMAGNAKPQNGRNGKQPGGQGQKGQGAESTGAEAGGDPTPGEGAQGSGGQKADAEEKKQTGTGAGQTDGEKKLKTAEQLAALGKLSVLLGRRSENLTGSASVEVVSGEQELTTRYVQKTVDHRDVHAQAERDEVSLELQSYVDNYFSQLRGSGVRPRRAQKK